MPPSPRQSCVKGKGVEKESEKESDRRFACGSSPILIHLTQGTRTANKLLPGGSVYALVLPVKLDFRRLDLQLAHTWTIARSSGATSAKVIVVELTGADGTVGLGEAAPTPRYKE